VVTEDAPLAGIWAERFSDCASELTEFRLRGSISLPRGNEGAPDDGKWVHHPSTWKRVNGF
jgi:hypothetical protein